MKCSKLRFLFAAFTLALMSACNQGRPLPSQDAPGIDHVAQAPPAPPKSVAHGTFILKKYEKFPFDVPPHVINPRVVGQFSSSLAGAGGTRVSDKSADVELMVMSETEFDDFSNGRSAESVDAIEPSHNHGVRITLPNSLDQPVRYYVVFRRSGEGKAPISVKADLTAEFGASM